MTKNLPNAALDRPILVTGSTGYIGGRLVPRLLEAGHRVRCLVREPRKLEDRTWFRDPRVEVVAGDASDGDAVRRALDGCGVSYYLIHSMMTGRAYRDQDRKLAEVFARSAEESGIERIIYLGGLGETGDGLSEHLTSRREVESTLSSGSVPVTVFRAAMIIGSGSASFEILRYLVERLPVMITPRWVKTESQPIAVRDVLHYLVECLAVPETIGRTLDIGGPDVVTYRELMHIMTEARGLSRRRIIPVPVLTPRLSSLWIHFVTPLSHRIARPLAEGLRNRVVCRDDEAHRRMPQDRLSVKEAIEAAIAEARTGSIETVWSDAGPIPGDPEWAGGSEFVDRRERTVAADPHSVFRAICRLGGGHGWYTTRWLWSFRGFIDRLVGGPGMRRIRREPEQLSYGEALDFWRVREIEKDRHLQLRAEMKLPGVAYLEFDVEPVEGGSRVVQTARYRPKGLLGLLYWYSVVPFHAFVFRGMLRGIERTAESIQESGLENVSTA